jgi:hypothetical protein
MKEQLDELDNSDNDFSGGFIFILPCNLLIIISADIGHCLDVDLSYSDGEVV